MNADDINNNPIVSQICQGESAILTKHGTKVYIFDHHGMTDISWFNEKALESLGDFDVEITGVQLIPRNKQATSLNWEKGKGWLK